MYVTDNINYRWPWSGHARQNSSIPLTGSCHLILMSKLLCCNILSASKFWGGPGVFSQSEIILCRGKGPANTQNNTGIRRKKKKKKRV